MITVPNCCRLDYCGIAILITGSFVPWLYYGFYCKEKPMIIYLFVVIALGIMAMVVSLWDKFSESRFRPLRAGTYGCVWTVWCLFAW